MKVEVDVLGSPSLFVRMVFVDLKHLLLLLLLLLLHLLL